MALASYGLISNDFQFQSYMILFLGLTMLVLGLQEFKRDKKLSGWILIGVFAFSIIAATQTFMWNY